MEMNHNLTSRFYDRISGVYDLMADSSEHVARETGQRLLNLRDGETVLEIGFGTGSSIVSLAADVGATGRIVGLDVSQGMQAVAARKISDSHLEDRVQLDIGDAREMPYADEEYDAVFMSFTLELFPREEIPKVLTEIKRVLKRDGRLGVVSMSVVPDGETPSALEKTYIWMHQHFPHIVDCQPIAVEQLLDESSFRISAKEQMEIWTMPVTALVGNK